ncbi:AAA family ATPase [uncultured Sphaerochaeta sp.]|uniref:AAA family ATPase n=1 Tax=uncultured Sphaerochaeta sp. TaxID=886478 RepID=UPI002A0A502D|nr:AAA family ATPase [uncultured Sphaerochaeta sp.]
MINKLVKIKNVGKFENTSTTSFVNWNGIFDKVNLIYGENGIGKTTFSQILRSLSNRDNLISRKRTFNSTDDQEILFLDDQNKQLEFKSNRWNNNISNISLFNSNYISENIISGKSKSSIDQSNSLYNIIIGAKGVSLYSKILSLQKSKKELEKSLTHLKQEKISIRKSLSTKPVIDYLEDQRKDLLNIKKNLNIQIRKLQTELGEYSAKIFKDFIPKVNYYLTSLTPDYEIKKIGAKSSQIRIVLQIKGNSIYYSDSPQKYSAKYVLSEADNSCIAFAFFLSQIQSDIKNRIVIFDDPVSSLDYNRIRLTINLINDVATQCKQLFILTHDLNFANLVNKNNQYSKSFLALKLISLKGTTTFSSFDIKAECLPPIFKDLNTVHNYFNNGLAVNSDKHEIIRCIRPILEGIIKIKYFSVLKEDEWLGEIIKDIRESSGDNPLVNLKPVYSILNDLNEYSKSFHHSTPTDIPPVIQDQELKIYIKKLIHVIYLI